MDKHNRIRPVPFQEAPSPPMTPEMYEACHYAIHVVKPNGEVLRAGRAAMFLLQQLGYPTLGRIGSWYPFIWFVELGYFLVARNRGRVYKYLAKGVCQKLFAEEENNNKNP
ncbi:MAG: hypothetical protein EP343_31935 [Deltaproteobacteria bacterium]|nr:MAG: hypothetical protein EP343_31935 [Deltaproteobacteria bacterium]